MSERIREHFGNIDEVLEAPNLIGIQKSLGAKNRFILFQFLKRTRF